MESEAWSEKYGGEWKVWHGVESEAGSGKYGGEWKVRHGVESEAGNAYVEWGLGCEV